MRVSFDGLKCSTGLGLNANDATHPDAGSQFPASRPVRSGRQSGQFPRGIEPMPLSGKGLYC